MIESMKYQRLHELANNIQLQLERLKAGELSLEELEIVVEQSREIYERLVVLRFKACGDAAQSKTEEVSTATIIGSVQTIVESKPETTNQVSLMDVIAEVTHKEEVAEEKLLFTFDANPVETPISNTLFDLAALPATQSVNDMLARTMVQQETVAQHHTHAPIADLKIAITLNQRFQFSRELFKGNNQDYEVAIERLNTSSRNEAMQQLQTLENKYEWSTGSVVVRDFRSLVERRHS
jgi:hypothetical protein